MSFRLHDSATGGVRDFVPLVEGRVSIYHCGLTVQSSPHLGHIRKEIVFDVLRRWLAERGYAVTVVANITDIEDKILAKSAATGIPWYEIAYRFERELHDAYEVLGCEPPSYEPRATGHVPEMIELIEALIERGHAYPAADGSGDVYFDVGSWPEYGSLSHQRVEDMEPAEDADPRGKRDPHDFALWKGHKPTEPATASWPTPWGRGRPGWHLECTAMATKYLGPEFDIHGGGIDLRFPHHENELAQARAAGLPFARYWMHNAWVTASKEKMSKSLGNGALVTEVVRRYPPRAVRFYLVAPHYRSTVEYTEDSLAEAVAALDRIDGFVSRASEAVTAPSPRIPAAFGAAMDDDLGTPQALAVVYTAVRDGNAALAEHRLDDVADRLAEVTGMLDVLGLAGDAPVWADTATSEGDRRVVEGLMAELVGQRSAARDRRDFAAADAIRDSLARLGVELTDTPTGTRWTISATRPETERAEAASGAR